MIYEQNTKEDAEAEFQRMWQRALDYKDEPWELDEGEKRVLCSEFFLDESYIREYKQYLMWGVLCQHQKMSTDFIIEMNQHGWIKWWNLAMNEKMELPEKLIEEHLSEMCRFNLVSWDIPIIDLFINKTFSKTFFMRNYCYICWERVYSTLSMRSSMILDKYKDWLIELGIDQKYSK